MAGSLVEITLGCGSKGGASFNNDGPKDAIRNDFHRSMQVDFSNFPLVLAGVDEFTIENCCKESCLNQIRRQNNTLIVGQFWRQGVVVPRAMKVVFNQLYNCPPLISRIEGNGSCFAFLHVFARYGRPKIVDDQVKHWMKVIDNLGDVVETIFAPRSNVPIRSCDTAYTSAVDHILKYSAKAIVLNRNLSELRGTVNNKGVCFQGCGYHLWGDNPSALL